MKPLDAFPLILATPLISTPHVMSYTMCITNSSCQVQTGQVHCRSSSIKQFCCNHYSITVNTMINHGTRPRVQLSTWTATAYFLYSFASYHSLKSIANFRLPFIFKSMIPQMTHSILTVHVMLLSVFPTDIGHTPNSVQEIIPLRECSFTANVSL